MNKPKTAQTQTAIRFPTTLIDRADKLAKSMSQDGMKVTRAEVLRLATFKGMEKIEFEQQKAKRP